MYGILSARCRKPWDRGKMICEAIARRPGRKGESRAAVFNDQTGERCEGADDV